MSKQRLIDGNALKYKIEQHSYPLSDRINSIENGMFLCGIYQAIDESTTADVVPVVRGEWMPTDMGGGETDEAYVCSACGEPWMLNDGTPAENNMHYCPNCGAKMESEGGARSLYTLHTRSVANKRTWRKLRRLLKACYTSTPIARFTARYTPQGFCIAN